MPKPFNFPPIRGSSSNPLSRWDGSCSTIRCVLNSPSGTASFLCGLLHGFLSRGLFRRRLLGDTFLRVSWTRVSWTDGAATFTGGFREQEFLKVSGPSVHKTFVHKTFQRFDARPLSLQQVRNKELRVSRQRPDFVNSHPVNESLTRYQGS